MADKEMKDQLGWEDFIEKGLQEFDGSSNVTKDFTGMTKRFGKHYIAYLEAAWNAKDEMSEEEFCAINGGVPSGFLKKFKK